MRLTSVVTQRYSKPPWRVMFFGTDDFSIHVLQALNENRMSSSSQNCVVKKLCVAHPRVKKKLSPVNKYADFCGLLQYEWPFKAQHMLEGFDVGVLASFGHLIPAKVINLFPHGIINVHPSLLPQWRGAAPLLHTILQGEQVTGVSIMSLEPKHFDRGKLLSQKEVDMPRRPTTNSLRDLLGPIGGKMIIDVLSTLPEVASSAQPQNTLDTNITYAHKITQPMSYVDWDQQTRDQIDRQYRAIHQSTELRSEWEGLTVRLLDMANLNQHPNVSLDNSSPAGLPIFSKRDQLIWIRCKDGWVGFKSIVIKKKMSAAEFFNGYLSKKHLKGVVFRSVSNDLFNESYENWIKNPKPS